jgi:alkylation response protein AidB-like acyl-CoA dehydrogenase
VPGKETLVWLSENARHILSFRSRYLDRLRFRFLFAFISENAVAVIAPLQSRDEILDRARELAREYETGAAERDRDRLFPSQEMQEFRTSGLHALFVPRDQGGSGAQYGDAVRAVRLLAEGDPNIAQMAFIHIHGVELYNLSMSPALQAAHNKRVLAGELLWTNAYSELGGKSIFDYRVKIARDGDDWVINGTKFYSTGSLAGDEAYINGVDPDTDEILLAYVPMDADGVTVHDDWSGMGQRTTASGTTDFDNVRISSDRISSTALVATLSGPDSLILGVLPQGYFGAILMGIARNAVNDAARYIAERARPWIHSGVERAGDDRLVQTQIGEIQARVDAAQALQDIAYDKMDEAHANLTPETRAHAALAMHKSKIMVVEAALKAGEGLFQMCGSASTLDSLNLGRHWRNARTLSLHDPIHYKKQVVGDYVINGNFPPVSFYT